MSAKRVRVNKNISFIDSSERRRKSFFGFTANYPDRLKSLRYNRKQTKRQKVFRVLAVFGVLLLIALGYFLASVVLELSYMPM